GLEVDRDAVVGDPAAHAHADRRDLGLAPARLDHPDADPVRPALAADVEPVERPNHPFLDLPDVTAQVGLAPLQIQHHVGDALARPVVGVLAATARLEHREA